MQQQHLQQQQQLQQQQLQQQQQSLQSQNTQSNNAEQAAPQGQLQNTTTALSEVSTDKTEDLKYLQFCSDINSADKKEAGKLEKKIGFPLTQPPNYTVTDCKCLVRTLTCAIKSTTFACIGLKVCFCILMYYIGEQSGYKVFLIGTQPTKHIKTVQE